MDEMKDWIQEHNIVAFGKLRKKEGIQVCHLEFMHLMLTLLLDFMAAIINDPEANQPSQDDINRITSEVSAIASFHRAISPIATGEDGAY